MEIVKIRRNPTWKDRLSAFNLGEEKIFPIDFEKSIRSTISRDLPLLKSEAASYVFVTKVLKDENGSPEYLSVKRVK